MGSVGASAPKYTAEQIRDAYEKYTSSWYKDIRRAQMGERIVATRRVWTGHGFTNEAVTKDYTDMYKGLANAIEQDLRDSSYTGTLYRAIGVDDTVLKTFKVGETINQRGISSWSTSESATTQFQGKGNTVVFVSSGPVQRAKDISGMSLGIGEQEVLQSGKNQQVITDVQKRGNITYVYVKDKR